MISLSLLSVGVAILIAAVAIMSMIATQDPRLIPATVNPFGANFGFDPSSDTLAHGHHAEQTMNGDWKSVELNSLFRVEELLDALEASNATKTEVELAGEDKFTVRWR
ncbi:hypothetical protein BH11PLA2_BH11PLA2_00510 [soil metagenome]